MKLTKEDIDKVRHIEGFPIAKDEDIIALSQPPYYTACPNPYVGDFIKQHGKPYDEATDSYHREPFATDVSEGKSDPIYNAHSYHTKVPYKAIMRYILHYTEPGDMVFDGFCGTGMTGVAAQMCEKPDNTFKMQIEKEMKDVKWGARKAILSDLSPVATFIAFNYNTPVNVIDYGIEANRIIDECEKELGWMYETIHSVSGETQFGIDGQPIKGIVNYFAWSDVFVCPHCSKELVFWDVAVDKKSGSVSDTFICNNCRSELKKTDCERAKVSEFDKGMNTVRIASKQAPVLVNYSVGKDTFEREVEEFDNNLLKRIEEFEINSWYPRDPIMFKGERWGDSWRAGYHQGITNVHHFYTKRNLILLSSIYNKIEKLNEKYDKGIINALKSIITGVLQGLSKQQRFRLNSGFPNMILSGTLYIGSLQREWNVINWCRGKLKSLSKMKISISKLTSNRNTCITTQSTTDLSLMPDNCIDYIFLDPPFGDNLMYSELNFIWESWLKVFTNNETEAIVNVSQRKGKYEYQLLMEKCFEEGYRILKPGRWITVEFHNSQNAIWNAIQEGLLKAGFVVADVRTLDKQQGSFKQVNSASAVKQDLIISAYKPQENFKKSFLEHAGSEDAVWEFVRQHLEQLPKVVENKGKIEVIAERQAYLLFDRMVAYHIMNGISVPLDAAEFYKGLTDRFIPRDGMYFLPDQLNEYDDKRIKMDIENVQLSFVVADEKTAIQWLYGQLVEAQTAGEIQPKFMTFLRELQKNKFEKIPELIYLLKENFLEDETGKWYIPDVNKASDLAKLRDKRLVKEFEDYVESTGKLKVFRMEAIRAGFDKCWKQRDFSTIVKVGKRLPESVVQEDSAILMYYDNALSRVE